VGKEVVRHLQRRQFPFQIGERNPTTASTREGVKTVCLYLFKRGMLPTQILIQTILHLGLRFGQAEAVNTSLAELLGHRSHTLRDYIRDNVALWLRS
jgi:hypothetical protein